MIREMTKKAIFACHQFYYNYHNTPFTVLRENLNKSKDAMCMNIVLIA